MLFEAYKNYLHVNSMLVEVKNLRTRKSIERIAKLNFMRIVSFIDETSVSENGLPMCTMATCASKIP